MLHLYRPRSLWLLLICAASLSSCAESVTHDAVSAAKNAEAFAQIAFVNQDIENAYALLADATKRYVSVAQFKEVLTKLHPKGRPKRVVASEYEPMAGGESAIYIFLTGENSGEQFYYRLTMAGNAATEYKVLRFDRGGAPYAPSKDKRSVAG
jgi:hypothetical protein